MRTDLRKALLDNIEAQGGLSSQQASPIVTLEDFFEGNEDEGSIGCNLINHPGVNVFYKTLKEIRQKFNVQDVLVEIYDIDEDYWPFSEVIYILTKASKEDVSKWVESLEPSEVGVIEISKRENIPQLKEGYEIISIWWD